jgi:hypothetical protein
VADPNFNQTNLTAMAAQMEIVWSRWNRSINAWSEPAALTANNYLDHAPLLCGPMNNGDILLVWTRNYANQLLGTGPAGADENDRVMWARWSVADRNWSTPLSLVSDLPYRLSQSLAGTGNRGVYAWTQDLDGVLTNATDQQVFYRVWSNGVWATQTQFTSDMDGNRNVRAAVASTGEAYLVWQKGTNLVMSRNFSTNLSLARSDSQTAGFADYAMTFGPAGNLVLLWQEMSQDGSDAHYVVYDPLSDTWSKDERLCQDSSLERSFAPVWDNLGNLTVAYDKVEILYTNKSVTLEGGGVITITNVPQPGRVDLVVTKRALVRDLALQAGDFKVQGVNYLPGDPLAVTALVRNSGNVAMSNVVVGFYDGNPNTGGALITNATVSGWLEAAASVVVNATWIVPEPAAPHTLFAVVNRANLSAEYDESNNTQSVSIGGTDLAVSLVSFRAETNGALRVIAQVQNLGAPGATNSVLAIRRFNETNSPLAKIETPPLEPGQLAQLALDLPAGTQPEGEVIYRLFADAEHAVPDVDTNNNTTAFAVNLWLDADNDKMPDGWEIDHGFDPKSPADANLDFDQDGLSNMSEYLAGTDPKDARSYLRIETITATPAPAARGIRLSWGSSANRLYAVERSGTVQAGYTNLAEHIQATPPENIFFDASATNSGPYYYRLRVE